MAGGGLFDPLGTDRPARAPRAGPSLWLIALLVLLIGVAGLFGTAAIRNGGEGGEPRVVAEIGAAHHIDPTPLPPPLGAADTSTHTPLGQSGALGTSDQEVEVENGVRVIRPRRTGSPGASLVMKVPPDAASTAVASPADNGLLEPGPSGLLPRVGSDGRRPAEVYAGAAVPGSTGKPMVAIVVGRFGNDSGGDAQAPTNWPAGVTLGFAVDGTDLARQVAKARVAGHEVVLMLPPQAGGSSGAAPPGGTGASSARDRLRWQLSRFIGYAGVVMDPTNLDVAIATTDILEMTRRGLYVVDTPSARRAATLTSSAHIAGSPTATADVTLTESAGSETPGRFLERLASLARSDGSAIGIAPASPRTFAAISSFAATLADAGIALVPLGAVVSLRQSAQARPIPVAAP